MNDNVQKTQPLTIITAIFAISIGVIAAILILPSSLPLLKASLISAEQPFFWYLSRATAIVAYFLLWVNLVMGISLSSKLANQWSGRAMSMQLHQFTSTLGLLLSLLHGLLLLGDHYLGYSVQQILIPFTSMVYKPFWVGLGQLSLYLWVLLILSFYAKKSIGKTLWRKFHYVGYLSFIFILIHGIVSGSDTSTPWMTGIYWSTGSIVLALTFYRVLAGMKQREPA